MQRSVSIGVMHGRTGETLPAPGWPKLAGQRLVVGREVFDNPFCCSDLWWRSVLRPVASRGTRPSLARRLLTPRVSSSARRLPEPRQHGSTQSCRSCRPPRRSQSCSRSRRGRSVASARRADCRLSAFAARSAIAKAMCAHISSATPVCRWTRIRLLRRPTGASARS